MQNNYTIIMKKTTLHILFATFILLGVLISCKSAWYTTCKVEKDEMIGRSRIIETNWGHLTTDRKYGYRLFKFKYDDGKLSLTLGVTSETYFSVSSGMRIDFLLEDGTIVSGIRTESGCLMTSQMSIGSRLDMKAILAFWTEE